MDTSLRSGGAWARVAAWVILGAGFSGSLQAALQNRLNGAAVYDTDLNVTWLTNLNLPVTNSFGVAGITSAGPTPGAMTWQTAQNWIAAMNAANYLGFSTWRLPTTPQRDPTCTTQDPVNQISSGFNCTSSELGHLFYSELGGQNSKMLSGTHTANYSLFQNVQDGTYWSDTTYPTDTFSAWTFSFLNGAEASAVKGSNVFYALAVLSGDVSSPKVLPQFAFGGGWYSAIYFTNPGSTSVAFDLTFMDTNGQPLVVPAFGNNKTTVNIVPKGTAMIEAVNSGSLSQGYVLFSLPVGVTGYAVFRQSVAGLPDQEALVPISSATTTSNTIIFDENALTTSVAIVNLSSSDNTVNITVLDALGGLLGTSTVLIPANGSKPSELRLLPGLGNIVGHRGTVQFSVVSGNVAVLALRFHFTSFTSIPTIGQ
jgi:hypothetical protein